MGVGSSFAGASHVLGFAQLVEVERRVLVRFGYVQRVEGGEVAEKGM